MLTFFPTLLPTPAATASALASVYGSNGSSAAAATILPACRSRTPGMGSPGARCVAPCTGRLVMVYIEMAYLLSRRQQFRVRVRV